MPPRPCPLAVECWWRASRSRWCSSWRFQAADAPAEEAIAGREVDGGAHLMARPAGRHPPLSREGHAELGVGYGVGELEGRRRGSPQEEEERHDPVAPEDEPGDEDRLVTNTTLPATRVESCRPVKGGNATDWMHPRTRSTRSSTSHHVIARRPQSGQAWTCWWRGRARGEGRSGIDVRVQSHRCGRRRGAGRCA